MRRRFALVATYAAFARLILALGPAIFFVLLDATGLYADQSNVAAKQIEQNREPNSRIVIDRSGQQIAEIRWQPGKAGPIGALRIPVGYLWRGIGMLNATFGPDYPDPNVIQPSMQTFILAACRTEV